MARAPHTHAVEGAGSPADVDDANGPSGPVRRAFVIGAARDCDESIVRSLEHADEIGRMFDTAFVFVYENDSVDGTLGLLRQWQGLNPSRHKLVAEVDVSGDRTQRIAHARNTLLDIVDTVEPLPDDVIVVMDYDEINWFIDMPSVQAAVTEMDAHGWTAIFPNQLRAYYDRWALRTGREAEECRTRPWIYCPSLRQWGLPYETQIPPTEPPIRVESAFGGFGIYKRAAIGSCRYDGRATDGQTRECEHVPFHKCVRENSDPEGQLYVVPSMLNHSLKGIWKERWKRALKLAGVLVLLYAVARWWAKRTGTSHV